MCATRCSDLLEVDPYTEKRVKKLNPEHLRAIADYICSMSDAEAALRADWFSGRVVPGMSLALDSI